jgi:hypothetical protein
VTILDDVLSRLLIEIGWHPDRGTWTRDAWMSGMVAHTNIPVSTSDAFLSSAEEILDLVKWSMAHHETLHSSGKEPSVKEIELTVSRAVQRAEGEARQARQALLIDRSEREMSLLKEVEALQAERRTLRFNVSRLQNICDGKKLPPKLSLSSSLDSREDRLERIESAVARIESLLSKEK